MIKKSAVMAALLALPQGLSWAQQDHGGGHGAHAPIAGILLLVIVGGVVWWRIRKVKKRVCSGQG